MKKCYICNQTLESILSLGSTPLANSLLSKEDLDKPEIFYPLELFFCENCFLVQTGHQVDPKIIFSGDYVYFSSISSTWLTHSQNFVEEISEELLLNDKSLVMEIASNDGYLLQYFKEKNIPVLGIEPASGTADKAIEKGIRTYKEFFNYSLSLRLLKENIKPDLIVANNVLAHNPDIKGFISGLKNILAKNGVITFEFPHLLNLIKFCQFDTIYHEHYYYLSLHTIKYLLAQNDLMIFKVQELKTHGGSLRVYVCHKDQRVIEESVDFILHKEKGFGLLDKTSLKDFFKKVLSIKQKLLRVILDIKSENKSIAGYGAPAKGNTLLNYCGLDQDFIDFTIDNNPIKQNKFLPGTRIPILSEDALKIYKPDFILILPWNIKEEIITKASFIRDWGGKFIIPIPEPEVV